MIYSPWFPKTFSMLSGSNICHRHNLLFNTIGVLPEETDAYNLIICLICASHSCLLLLTIFEMIFFYLYNSKFHPFKMILQPEGILLLQMYIYDSSWYVNITRWERYGIGQQFKICEGFAFKIWSLVQNEVPEKIRKSSLWFNNDFWYISMCSDWSRYLYLAYYYWFQLTIFRL